MGLVDWSLRWMPAGLKRSIKQVLKEQTRENLDAPDVQQLLKEQACQNLPVLASNDTLSSLYAPALGVLDATGRQLTWSRQRVPPRSADDPLPLPPAKVRMGYAADDDAFYLSWGETTATGIRRILERERVRLTPGTALLDWGCASGRVVRHFAEEARAGEVWGADVDGSHILWAKENLSPPFRFLTCTAFPHLPFEDNKFRVIYSISVFTHIIHLVDMWLMEARRILELGGYALFTIHDEHSWQNLYELKAWENGLWSTWLTEQDLARGLGHDIRVFRAGRADDWGNLQVFYKTDWVRQEWGRYLDVVSIEPLFEYYQSLVVLRKPLPPGG